MLGRALVVYMVLLTRGAGAAPPEPPWQGLAVATSGQALGVLQGNAWRCVRLFGVAVPYDSQARNFVRDRVLVPITVRQGRKSRQVYLGSPVTVTPVTRDRDKTLLARVSVDGVELNAALIAAGHAFYDPRRGKDKRYFALEARARAAGQGLWANPGRRGPGKQDELLRELRHEPLHSVSPGLEDAVTVSAPGPVRGDPASRLFHLTSCEQFLCAGCSVAFASAAAALRKGYRPHSCVRYVGLDLGPPPGRGDAPCRGDRDCVSPHYRCSPCSPCKLTWPEVTNRATFRRQRAQHRRQGPVKCGRCWPCPCGQSLWAPSRYACVRGRCAVLKPRPFTPAPSAPAPPRRGLPRTSPRPE